jgi:benzoyl-CoA 2,3-epoxidase subunit A
MLKHRSNVRIQWGDCDPAGIVYFGERSRSPEYPGKPRQYVQDLIRERSDAVARLLQDPDGYTYICGLKGMEQGVDEAFRDVCRQRRLDWDQIRPQLLEQNRIHIETY